MELPKRNWLERTEDFFVNWARAGLIFIIAWMVINWVFNFLYAIFGEPTYQERVQISSEQDTYVIAFLASAILLLAFRIERYIEELRDQFVYIPLHGQETNSDIEEGTDV